MNKRYSINFRYQVLSLKQATILLALCPVFLLLNAVFPLGVLIGRLSAKTTPLDQYWEQLATSFILMVLLCLPAFLLHFLYHIKNRNLSFEVSDGEISINECGNMRSYKIADIIIAEKVLAIVHKNKIDNKGRWSTPWSNYGYIKVEFSDGKVYHFTSLVLDPVNFDDFQTRTRYTFFPILSKKAIADRMQDKKYLESIEIALSEEKIEEFRERFFNYSDDELLEKINDSRYCKEAILAAQQILEGRRHADTIANGVKND